MTELLPALLRTVVPLLYGLLIRWGLGNYLPDETVTTVATLLITGAIYLLLRLLEALQPKIGILLGWAKQPQYADVVKGVVLNSQDVVKAATKEDLDRLHDDIGDLIEKKVNTAVSAALRKTSSTAKKTTAKKAGA